MSAAELESQINDLTVDCFEAFAEDISTMFDTNVEATQMDYSEGTCKDLKDTYKKLAAVCSVKAEGILNGNFHVVFDREGLFTLAGTFVMQPEKVIAGNRKSGTEEEAKEIGDAMGEVGNLMVGSWDRIFRDEVPEHKHFVQSGSFIGNPWTKPEDSISVGKEEDLLLIQYQMTVAPLDPFLCTMIYPKTLFDSSAAPPPQPAQEPAEETAKEEPAEQPAAEQPPAEQEQPPAEKPQAAEQTPAEPPAAEQPPEQPPAQQQPQPASPAADSQIEQTVQPQAQPQPQPQNPPAGQVSQAIQNLVQTGAISSAQQNDTGMLAEVKSADIMRKGVAWALPDDTVEKVVNIMQQQDTGYVMIGESGRLQGIVSKSDVRGAMSPYLQSMFVKWRGPMDTATLQIKSKWIMSRPVRTVRPDTNIGSIMRAMMDHGGRCVPVVDDQGAVIGTVNVFDIFRALTLGAGSASVGVSGQAPPLA